MSDITFEEVVDLARQLSPVDKARLVEQLAADLSANGDHEIQVRLQRFKAVARSIGEEAERLGINEDDAVEMVAGVRRERRNKAHG